MLTSEDFNADYGVSQKQAENIADPAARRAEERLYTKVGRNVVTRSVYAIGSALIAIAVYLSDWVHIGPPAK